MVHHGNGIKLDGYKGGFLPEPTVKTAVLGHITNNEYGRLVYLQREVVAFLAFTILLRSSLVTESIKLPAAARLLEWSVRLAIEGTLVSRAIGFLETSRPLEREWQNVSISGTENVSVEIRVFTGYLSTSV